MLVTQLKKYVFKTRIEFDDNEFVELREPTQAELIGLSDNDDENIKLLTRLFPACVVDSSFVNESNESASGKEIYENLKDSGSMMSEIITTWLQSIPFQHRLLKNKKSGN